MVSAVGWPPHTIALFATPSGSAEYDPLAQNLLKIMPMVLLTLKI
jgi:hypothetical protein